MNPSEPIELRDEQGNVLGHFTPPCSPEEQALYEKAKKLFDPVEMERLIREEKGQGIPLAEFWKQIVDAGRTE